MRSATSIGFYGKLPCKGDFLQRRAPQEFVDAWDPWLQESLHISREYLQERWLDVYLTSPVWRFVLSEGVCGTGSYAGVMLPSVDRVGRYFPLTIVAQWNVADCALELAAGAQGWFDAAEALALAALDANDLDIETFDGQVAALTQYIDPNVGEESAYLRELMDRSPFPHAPELWHVPVPSVHSVSRAVNALAFRELQRSLRPLALWWTEGSNPVGPAWLSTRGLPPPRSFLAMMSGHWGHMGWTSIGAEQPGRAELRGSAALPQSAAPAEPAELQVDPLIEITACHEPLSREWGAPSASARFVERPDVGLWGVATSDETDLKHEDAQAVADVLLNVPQSGTLTSLVEDVRRMLDQVLRYRASAPAGTAGGALPFAARAVIFLARGEECALVCSGDVQALRCRSSDARPVVGLDGPVEDPFAPPPSQPTESGSLMDLLATGPAAAAPVKNGSGDIIVRYDSLRAGDAWVLSGAPLFEKPQLPALAAGLSHALAQSSWPLDPALSAVRAACSANRLQDNTTFPVMLIATRAGLLT